MSLFCNVPIKAVIEERDVESSIYELPLMLHQENLDELVVQGLHLDVPPAPIDEWLDVVRRLKYPENRVTIGIVGKYMDLQDSYLSVYESLTHGGIANDSGVSFIQIDAEALEKDGPEAHLKTLDGILVPGGFGDRGTEGKILAAQYAREQQIPYFGLCLGMQIAVIEFARNVAGLTQANSAEFAPETPDPVIDIMEDQKDLTQKGGSMRLGAQPCRLQKGSHSANAYKVDEIYERHRHRYEFNNHYRDTFSEKGLVFAGVNPERDLVEIIEVADHPWFVGVQFHPEFKSKPNKAHPLFAAFIKAALNRHNSTPS